MKTIWISVFSVLLCVFRLFLSAQNTQFPNQYIHNYFHTINTTDSFAVSPVFPDFFGIDTVVNNNSSNKGYISRKLFSEQFVKIDSSDYQLVINPKFVFSYGKERGLDYNLFENSRGFEVRGNFFKKLFFSSELYESQFIVPSYLHFWIDSFGVAPGIMRVKEFKQHGWDAGSVYGSLAYKLNRNVSMILARDKIFIGDGYRSMFVSNNPCAYNFFQAIWKNRYFRYDYFLAFLQNAAINHVVDAPQSSLAGFQSKYATISTLSLKVNANLHLGLFESMVWNPMSNTYNALHPRLFNPLILSNALYYGLSSKNNAAVGVFANYKPLDNLKVYSQFLIDELANSGVNKTAAQFGISYEGNSSLPLQCKAEVNCAGPYSYGHISPLQSYSHVNQSLAHPFGANFREYLFIAHIAVHRFVPYLLCSLVDAGIDSPEALLGQNIFAPQPSTVSKGKFLPFVNGRNVRIIFLNPQLHYLVNPATGMHLFAGLELRQVKTSLQNKNNIVLQFGISTNIRQFYKDVSWF